MIKLFWYIVSILTIFFILVNNPSSNNVNNFINQNKFFTFSSNQLLIQRLIFFNIILFIVFTILCSIYI
uniref:Preprotein-translocase subunit g n=1 Tax=Apoglossum ruscifolium TaxID=167976 RepID=A0A4D6WMM9_9FLOR|nr:Preprotein-translocase subunit g [Apoglossum ruscifolium]